MNNNSNENISNQDNYLQYNDNRMLISDQQYPFEHTRKLISFLEDPTIKPYDELAEEIANHTKEYQDYFAEDCVRFQTEVAVSLREKFSVRSTLVYVSNLDLAKKDEIVANNENNTFYYNFIDCFEKIIQENGYIDLQIHLANTKAIIFLTTNNLIEALKTSQSCRKACYKGNSSIHLGETYLIKATLELARGNFDSAITNCQKSVKIFNRNLLEETSESYYTKLYAGKGRTIKNNIIKRNLGDSHCIQGLAYAKNNDGEQAIKCLSFAKNIYKGFESMEDEKLLDQTQKHIDSVNESLEHFQSEMNFVRERYI